MGHSGWRRWVLALVGLGMLIGSRPVSERARVIAEEHELFSRQVDGATPPEYILASSLLGGFRGVIITALWIRAQEMKNDDRYYEMVDIYNIITKLQPTFPAAWAFQAWDLTYNVSVEQLMGKRRLKQLVRPRHVAMWLVREQTDLSFPDIGRVFGRDHATIQHACKKIRNNLVQDADLRSSTEAILRTLGV